MRQAPPASDGAEQSSHIGSLPPRCAGAKVGRVTVIAVGVLVWVLGNVAFVALRYRATADRRTTVACAPGIPSRLRGGVEGSHAGAAQADRSSLDVPAPTVVAAPSAGTEAAPVPAQRNRRSFAVPAQARRRAAASTGAAPVVPTQSARAVDEARSFIVPG